MVKKTMKKGKSKKSVKKKIKSVDRKTTKKSKLKPSQKSKIITSQKPIAKKIPLKKKSKTTEKTKTIPQRPVVKKPAPKTSEEERKAILRRVLIHIREEIVKEAKSEISKYIKGETKQLVDTALDDGDWSIIDLSEDINLKQLSTHRETLLKIDEALRKLNEGTYGKCEDCGEEISEERLRILPFAIYCRDCQEKQEQLAEIESEEGPRF